jgi:hypothetical protein
MSVNMQLALLAAVALAALALSSCGAATDSAFDGWDKIEAPPPPRLERVEADPETTARRTLRPRRYSSST